MILQRQKYHHRSILKNKKGCNRRAVLLIEMAFVLPVLVIVLVLAIDISRFLIVTMALNNAANQGAVAGSNHALNLTSQSAWNSQIQNAISNSMAQYSWFDDSRLSVTIPTPLSANGMIDANGFRSIEVHITYQADYVIPWQGYSSPGLVTLKLRTDQVR